MGVARAGRQVFVPGLTLTLPDCIWEMGALAFPARAPEGGDPSGPAPSRPSVARCLRGGTGETRAFLRPSSPWQGLQQGSDAGSAVLSARCSPHIACLPTPAPTAARPSQLRFLERAFALYNLLALYLPPLVATCAWAWGHAAPLGPGRRAAPAGGALQVRGWVEGAAWLRVGQ